MTSMFVVHEPVKVQYAGIYILKVMEEGEETFNINLTKSQKILEPVMLMLLKKDYIANQNGFYKPTTKGLKVLKMFTDHYRSFLKEYDIFCGVNLKDRDLALNYISPDATPEEWHDFLNQDQWDDLRIAIAEYKGLDAIEIVFNSFVHDQRFGKDESGWSYDLLLGSIWDEIQAICNSAIRLASLSYEKDGIKVAAETVIQEIIEQGFHVAQEWKSSCSSSLS